MNNVNKRIALLLAGSVFLGGMAGCERRDTTPVNKGPAETAGKKIDEATVQAGKELNKLMDKAGQQMEKAGEKMQESAKKAQTSADTPSTTSSTSTSSTNADGSTTTTTTTDKAPAGTR